MGGRRAGPRAGRDLSIALTIAKLDVIRVGRQPAHLPSFCRRAPCHAIIAASARARREAGAGGSGIVRGGAASALARAALVLGIILTASAVSTHAQVALPASIKVDIIYV